MFIFYKELPESSIFSTKTVIYLCCDILLLFVIFKTDNQKYIIFYKQQTINFINHKI